MHNLNTGLLKVCYSDVSIIQMFVIQIPTVLYLYLLSKILSLDKQMLRGPKYGSTQMHIFVELGGGVDDALI